MPHRHDASVEEGRVEGGNKGMEGEKEGGRE